MKDDQPALIPVEHVPTAGDLVASWCAAYTTERGTQPHRSVLNRVRGQARTLAKDCETLEEWRIAWRAFGAAGRAGRFDPLPFYIDDQPRSLYVVPEREPTGFVKAMRGMTGPRQVES